MEGMRAHRDSQFLLKLLEIWLKGVNWSGRTKKTGAWNGHSSVIFGSWKPEEISKNGNNTICLNIFCFMHKGVAQKLRLQCSLEN